MTRRTGTKAIRVAKARADKRRATRIAGLSVLAAGVAMAILVISVRTAGAAHPEPRDMDHSGHVVSHERYAARPRVHTAYAQAAEIPHVLDGIYCYCRCSQHSRHYSLLDCFTSDHGARCDICLTEASVAYRMASNGGSIGEIRKTIDALY